MRTAFVEELTKLASENKNIILLTGDLGFSVFEEFEKKLPKQFVNCGVAESNMIGVAAGLAKEGFIVFCYSIATFSVYRPFEFIRNDVCQNNLSVIIVGSGAGLTYGDAGPSHHATEDFAVLNALPNMHIFCPSGPLETRWATKQAVILKKPAYLRIGKKNEPDIIKDYSTLKIGEMNYIEQSGKDFLLVTTGTFAQNAIETQNILFKKGIKGTVMHLPTIKPLNRKSLIKEIIKFSAVFTIEDHQKSGGLGSIIAEIIASNDIRVHFKMIGIEDLFFPYVGSQEYIREKLGISAKSAAKTIKKVLS